MTCVIIDYGSGNLHSAQKSFERAANQSAHGKKIILTNDPETIAKADHIVLPGVGAYADCLQGLEAIDGLREALEETVIEKQRPFLGICVGMQLMSTEGHEHGITTGLDWIKGKVVPIRPNNPTLKIPHMGWNTLSVIGSGSTEEPGGGQQQGAAPANGDEALLTAPHPLLEGVDLGASGLHAYFVHSYHFEVEDAAHRLATTDYGGPITAMVGRDNIVGTQFHPEKSQTLGLKLISNFLEWRP